MKSQKFILCFVLLNLLFVVLNPARSAQMILRPVVIITKKKDYASAAGYLKRAVQGTFKLNPAAHYWYGAALMKEARIDDAIRAYAEAYSLSPHTSIGENALKILKRYDARIKGSKQLNEFVSQRLEKKVSSDTTPASPASAVDLKVDSKSQVSMATIESVKKRLKPLQKHEKPGPTITEFRDWPVTMKTNYGYTGCFQAVAKAQTNLNSAQEQFKAAERIAGQLVPSNRSFGDSEAQFNSRKKAGEKAYESVMEPYKNEVAECARLLREANKIKDIAVELLNTPLMANPNYDEVK